MTKVIESHPELDELLKEFKTETAAEEAIRILEPIPDEKWIMGNWVSECGMKHCALGWINFKKHRCQNSHPDVSHHSTNFLGPAPATNGFGSGIANVNDGNDIRYQQPTPKQRVIALLRDMIKAGY